MNKNVIAENIIRVRKRSGMSQKELAEMIGTQQQQISQWESGNRIPKIDTILRISKALSCSPKEICPVFENESECICSADDIFKEFRRAAYPKQEESIRNMLLVKRNLIFLQNHAGMLDSWEAETIRRITVRVRGEA